MLDSWVFRDRLLGFLIYLESISMLLTGAVILAASVDLTLRGFYAEGLLAVLFAGVVILVGLLVGLFGKFIFKNAETYAEKTQSTRAGADEER